MSIKQAILTEDASSAGRQEYWKKNRGLVLKVSYTDIPCDL
ncbi:MAG: hypothetical protein RLO17_07450 [Cyclobacteriaceae bacterium]